MSEIEKFVETVRRLRAPGGCPWDREQNHKTLKRYLIEEAYETIDAIDSDNPKELMEELGDVLLQVVLHSQIASENNDFTFEDVACEVNKKMISRHPHVFSNVKVKDTQEVLSRWEELKKNEKPHRKSVFDGIPNSLPALLKGLKVSKKASKDGFEWKRESDLWSAFESEIIEFKETLKGKNIDRKKEEFGDLLFMIVNLARWYKLDPEESLNNGIKKFIRRYDAVKKHSKNIDLKKISEDELEVLWKKAKQSTKKSGGKNAKKKKKSK